MISVIKLSSHGNTRLLYAIRVVINGAKQIFCITVFISCLKKTHTLKKTFQNFTNY